MVISNDYILRICKDNNWWARNHYYCNSDNYAPYGKRAAHGMMDNVILKIIKR